MLLAREDADAPHPPWLLRACRERPRDGRASRFSAHEATLCREARKNQNGICGLQLRMKDALPRLLIPP